MPNRNELAAHQGTQGRPAAKTTRIRGARGRFSSRDTILAAIDSTLKFQKELLGTAERAEGERAIVILWLNQNPAYGLLPANDPRNSHYREKFHKAERLKEESGHARATEMGLRGRLTHLKKRLAEFDTMPMAFIDPSVLK